MAHIANQITLFAGSGLQWGGCRKEVFCAVPDAADMDSGAIGYEETTWKYLSDVI